MRCQQFPSLNKPKKKRDEVRVDPLSVELCLSCTLPVEKCRGAPSTHIGAARPCHCAYEKAIAARRQIIELPGPGPDGSLRRWKCRVER